MPAFVSQHTSAEIDGAISAIIGDTASPNGTTIVTTISGSEYVALWDAGTPKTITYANFVADVALESGLLEGIDDRVAALLAEGNNVTLTYDDGADSLTISVDAIDDTVVGGVIPAAGTFTTLTGDTVNADILQYDTAAALGVDAAGQVTWDVDAETLMLGLNADTHIHIGQDTVYHAINQTGSDIAKGKAVYAVGTVGNSGKISIAEFTADGTYDSKYFMGVTSDAIANGDTGFVTHFGKVRKINTNAFNEGDILYADPSTAGGLTTTRPSAGNNIITVAIVVTKSATVGEIFVRPTFEGALENKEDVTFTSVASGEIIKYDGSKWINNTLFEAGIQEYDAGLTSIAGLPTIADKMLYTTATDTWDTTTVTSFARAILDDADAATVRATIDVDQAGTDNSTDVTLSGSYDYLTITDQDITLGQIDLQTDVANTLLDASVAESNVTQHEGALSIASSQISDKALANGLASLDGSGKVPSAQLPALALTDVFVVASQSAQLALTAQEGDLVIRTDESKTYVHNGGTAGTMADYTELQFPDAVTSVNSLTGTVVLDTDDVSEGSTNLYYTDARADARISAAALNDLSDVVQTSIATGDLLRWSGTEWVNYADSNYAVASHTHTSSDVTDFAESVDDQVATLLVGGTNVSLSYDDGAGTLTINSSVAAGPLNDVTDVTIASASTGDLLRYNGSIWVNYADSAYAAASHAHTVSDITDFASHTHTVSSITDFGEGVDDQVATLLTAGDNITITYDDGAGTLTLEATGGSGFNPVANALFAGY